MGSTKLFELEERCVRCNGFGGNTVEGYGGWRRCDLCNGSGYVATEFGEKILELMRHNFRLMLEDVQNDE